MFDVLINTAEALCSGVVHVNLTVAGRVLLVVLVLQYF
jgi:hypothetical protein